MSQSLSMVIIHIIFSTKDRFPCLDLVTRQNLHAYLGTVSRNSKCETYRVGGTADHVHLAVRLCRTVTIAELVEELKTSSSKWLKMQRPGLHRFSWQRGYGAFSVNTNELEPLIAYIANQGSITGSEHSRKNIWHYWRNMAFNSTNDISGIDPMGGLSALFLSSFCP